MSPWLNTRSWLCALCLAAALCIPAAGAPAAEPDAPVSSAGAAETAGPTAAETARDPSAAEKPQAPTVPPPQRRLTEEEIRELPILNRYDLPLEKGREMLADVKDNTFDYDEPAFYWMAFLLSRLPRDKMVPGPDDEDMPYEQLMATPSSFRGVPVTIRGIYMTVTPWRVPVVALAKDIPRLFTCTIREEPMDKEMPVATVVVLDDPMAYLKAFDEVRVKGYFYKVRRYKGTKGEGFAPMIIAQRIEPATPVPGKGPMPFAAAFRDPAVVVMIGLIILLAVGFFVLRHRTRARSHATGESPYLRHRIRLQRGDRTGPPEPGGPGSRQGGAQP